MTEETQLTPGTSSKHPGAGLIAVLAGGALSALMQLYLVIPMAPRLRDRFEMTDAGIAWMIATFGLAFGLGNLVFGPISDRYDRRFVMAIGLLGSAVSALVAGYTQSASVLLLARGSGGFFTAAFAAVALAYLGEVLQPRLRPIGLSIVSGCFLLAGIVGQGLGLAGVRTVGTSIVFVVSAVPLVVSAVLVLRLPKGPIGVAGMRIRDQLRSARRLLRRPPIVVSYIAAVTLLLAFVGLYAGISTAGAAVLGTDDLLDLYLFRLVGVPGILFGIVCGPLIRRWGSVRVGTLSLVTASTGLALVAASQSVVSITLFSGVFVLGLAVAVPSVVATVSAAATTDRGLAMAGYGSLVGLGACVAPLFAAALIPSGLPALCLVLAAIMAAVSVVFGYGARRRV